MTIETKLKNLILEQYGTMLAFSKACGIKNTTLATIMSRGIHNANIDNIIKMCHTLGISVDELAHDRITPVSNISPPAKDVDLIIKSAKLSLLTADHLTIEGKAVNDDDKQKLADMLDMYYEMMKISQRSNE